MKLKSAGFLFNTDYRRNRHVSLRIATETCEQLFGNEDMTKTKNYGKLLWHGAAATNQSSLG